MLPNYLKNELSILFFITEKNPTSLVEINEMLEFPKRTIKEYILKINVAYEDHLNIDNFILSNNQGIIYINPIYEQKAVEYAYLLKLYLLKTNTLFNYCVLLTTQAKIKREDLLEQLHVSQPYLNKITTQLNKFLKSLSIFIQSSNGYYLLSGNEVHIRLFAYLLLQDSFQDIEWPFKNIPLENIHKKVPENILNYSEKNSHTKKRALFILYAILQTRICNRKIVERPASKELYSFFQLLKDSFDITLFFHDNTLGHLSPEDKTNEILYFNFFLVFLLQM